MENAGRQVAQEALKMLHRGKRVVIFCGKGNNGGDGFVAARHLLVKGIRPDIFLAGKINAVENEARQNLDILLRLKTKIIEVAGENLYLLKNRVLRYNLIIDALLGIGLSGEVRGILKDLIGIINLSKAKVLSIDIPSGLDATTGRALGCCVKADRTVTFVARKRGMIKGEGPKNCGRVVVRDLGISL
jgi:NAD(P)H-hydrate epimerase